MKRTACLLALPAILAGCGVFLPEAKLDYSTPMSATASLQDAYAYAEDAKGRLYAVGDDNSLAQNLISYGTYVATLTGAGLVAFSAPSSALKGAALGAGAIVGLDYVASPRARRSITDDGISAISCLEKIALAMDALPQGFGAAPASSAAPGHAGQGGVGTGQPTASGGTAAAPPLPRSPVSVALATGGIPTTMRRAAPVPAYAGAAPPPPSAPVPVADTWPTAAADSMREYANSLLGGAEFRPPAPRGAGAPAAPPSPRRPRVPTPVAAVAAGLVLQAANTQEAAMQSAASAAKATSASAPMFLVSNAENVLRLVVRQIHGADRAAADIETQTHNAVNNALKDFQGAAFNASTQTASAKQTLNTTAALTGSGGIATTLSPALLQGSGGADTPPSDVSGGDFPPAPAAQGAAPGGATTGGSTQAGGAGPTASSGQTSASKANTYLNTDSDATAFLKQLTDFNTACQGLAPGSSSSGS